MCLPLCSDSWSAHVPSLAHGRRGLSRRMCCFLCSHVSVRGQSPPENVRVCDGYSWSWLLTWLYLEWTKIQKWKVHLWWGSWGRNTTCLWSRSWSWMTHAFNPYLEAGRHTFNLGRTFCWTSKGNGRRKGSFFTCMPSPCQHSQSLFGIAADKPHGTEQLLDAWTFHLQLGIVGMQPVGHSNKFIHI